MSASLAPQWIFQALTADGKVASGAKLYSYISGTSTPSPLYADEAMTTPLANPIELDAGGYGEFWVDDSKVYRLRLEDADGGLIKERDRISSKKSYVVNLDDFGATGDGVTNDYAAWLLAMAALSAGGELKLGAKTYAMDPTDGNFLSLPVGVSVRGVGSASVLYLFASGDGRGAVKPYNGNGRNTLSSFRISGPGAARSAAAGSCGVYATGAQNLTIENVEVDGVSGAGINLKNAKKFVVEACYVHDTGADGIHMPSAARRGNVYGNHCESTGDDGISVVGYKTDDIPEHINIFGNDVIGGQKRGITVIGGRKIHIIGNHVEDCAVSGIFVASEASYDTWGCEDISIAWNTLYRISRTYNATLGASVFAYAAMLSGRPSQRSRNISFCDNTIADCAAISGGTANGSTNLVYAQNTDGLIFSRNRASAGPFQEVGDTAKTKRFAYIIGCSNITANENTWDTCAEIGMYLDSDCTGFFEAIDNKFLNTATDGGFSVIQIDSTQLVLSISKNIEVHSGAAPTYFVRCPSGVADPTTTDVSANITTLSNFNVPPSSSAPVTESETFADLETSPQSGRLYMVKDRGILLRGRGVAGVGISNATGRAHFGMADGPDGALWMTVFGGTIYRGVPDLTTGAVTWAADASAVSLGNQNWRGIWRVGKRLYAAIDGGTIYQATVSAAGAATWTTTGAASRAWRAGCRVDDTRFLVTVDSGDVYLGTIAGSSVSLSALSASPATRQGIAYVDGWVYWTVSGGDIYRVEFAGGVLGTPVALGLSALSWTAIIEGPDKNIYATIAGGSVWRGVPDYSGNLTWTDLAVSSQDRRGMAIGRDHRIHIAGYNGVTRFYRTAYVEVGK